MSAYKFCDIIFINDNVKSRFDKMFASDHKIYEFFLRNSVIGMESPSDQFLELKGSENCNILNVVDSNLNTYITIMTDNKQCCSVVISKVQAPDYSVWDTGTVERFPLITSTPTFFISSIDDFYNGEKYWNEQKEED
jgi:hypothetical protein